MFEGKRYESLEQLMAQNRFMYHFGELCRIPHPSFHEKKLSDFLVDWARGLGLEASQDDHFNVWIKKPASPGYESAPAVMLQAHIDMVCEKAPGVEHDFYTDPIHLELEGDLLSTGGRTTLGADDGIGVACAMAILEADDIPHPPLEVLFTTAEEDDMSGALSVDTSCFQARMLINIDNAVEHDLLAGSCGGTGVELSLPADRLPVPGDWLSFEIAISGLPGGHSGEDIHRGHGNANILLGRLLRACEERFPFYINEVEGGSFRLAIPRDARAVISIGGESESALRETAEQMKQIFQMEYEAVAPELSVLVEKDSRWGTAEAQEQKAGDSGAERTGVSPEACRRLIRALYLSPDGISEMNNAVPGVVESSDNLGEIHLEEGAFRLVYEIRASFETTRAYIYEKIRLMAELLGGTVKAFADYPSWAYRPSSRLRSLASRVYRREFGEEIRTLVVHCGLECGCLAPKMPGLDVISIGPDCWGLHSPQERLSVSSADRVYHYIKCILAEMKEL